MLIIDGEISNNKISSSGESSLHLAVLSGDEACLSAVVKECSKLTSKTKEGKTPLQLAREHHPELISVIDAAKFQKVPWQEIKPNGKWPIPRCSHSASQYNNRWYIYGGSNDFNNPTTVYDDMHFYNADSNEWRLLAPRPSGKGEPVPTELSGHTSMTFGSKLYIFGGKNLEKTFNDLWVLDLGKLG